MATIDERVVAMSFENAKFEQGVSITINTLGKLDTTLANIGKVNGLQNIEADANKVTLTGPMSALDKLKQKLGLATAGTTFTDMEAASQKVGLTGPMSALDKLQGKLGTVSAGTTFTEMEKAGDRVTFSGLTSAIDGIGNHLSFLSTTAAVALGGLVTQASQAAGGLAKALSLDSISGGLKEYETNLNSIQTILANTQASGATLDDVNEALLQLNKYSDQTIYNFSEMAKNIGTFTAAGVDLDTSVSAIKGIANLAAISGSNSAQASTAMYQLSQAIASGKVSLQDWNSVVNAGMGGTTFQRALAQTAEKMGTLSKGSVELKGKMKNVTVEGQSFRESITAKPGEKSWLTSDVLTSTLSQFTGDLTDAQLAAQGFNDQEIAAIQQTARTAKAAATEVKTLGGVFDVAKETMGSGWSQTFQTIFGTFTEAKKTFTELSNSINGFINESANARNKVLGDWKELGGRKELIEGIKNVFEALGSVLKPIRDAFRQVFPPKTGQELFNLTKSFREFAEQLKVSPETADNLRRIFAGLFAVLDIGWTIVKKIAGVIGDLIGVISGGSGGFLSFAAAIGDFLVSVDDAISKGDSLSGVFEAISAVLQVPLEILQELAGAFFGLFDGVDVAKGDAVAGSLERVGEKMAPLQGIMESVAAAWQEFVDILNSVWTTVQPILDKIVGVIGSFFDTITNAFVNADFDAIFAVLNTGLIAGIFLAIKKGLGLNVDIGGGVLKNLSETFGALTNNLKAMQKNIQAGTLLKIAGAIAVLAAAVLVLSTIDPKKLAKAMTAVAVGMGELAGALAILSKFSGGAGFITLPIIALGMIAVAAAVLILAGAIKIFSTMSWEDIAKGLAGVAGALTAVGLGVQLIGPSILLIGPGLLAVAIAMNILAVAVKIFGSMKWEDLAKGLLGVAGALLAMGLGLALIGPEVLIVGPGLIAAAIAMSMLAGAVKAFGGMKPEELAQGIIGMGLALAALAGAIILIPPTVALQAAGLVILAIALQGIAKAVKTMGGLDIEVIIRGLTAIAGVLLIFAIGLSAMQGTLGGSAALLVAAAAFAVLAPTLAFMGTLKWSTIFRGLAAIALTLGVLAVVGALAAAPLAALGAALVALGLGLLVVVSPIYILAKALQLLGDEGVKGVAVMVAALTAFVAILPKIIINFIQGLVGILAEVAKIAPAVLLAIGTMLDTIILFIIENAPKLAEAVGALIQAFLQVLVDNAPSIVAAGVTLLLNLLAGIDGSIGEVVIRAANIIATFLSTLALKAPDLAASGVALLIAFLQGIISQVPAFIGTVIDLVVAFVNTVASNLTKVAKAGLNLMLKFIAAVASTIPKVIEGGLDIALKLIEGIGKGASRLVSKAVDMIGDFLRTVAHELVRLVNIGYQAIIDFLNGMAAAIRNNNRPLLEAAANLGRAVVDAILEAIDLGAAEIIDAIENMVGDAIGAAEDALDLGSPSRVFMEIGGLMMEGWRIGIVKGSDGVVQSVDQAAKDAVDATAVTLSSIPNMLDSVIDADPIITPVLDLSQVTRDAQKLGELTNVTPITAAVSFDQATAISNAQKVSETAAAEQAAQAGSTFNFEQNNYSPEALSDIEIYRQTNNQLSQLKQAVGL